MEKSKISAFLEKAGISIVCVLSAAIAFWLSLISLLHTVTVDDIPEGKSIMSSLYYIRQDNESVIYSNDSFFFNIIYLLLSIAAMYILSKKAVSDCAINHCLSFSGLSPSALYGSFLLSQHLLSILFRS